MLGNTASPFGQKPATPGIGGFGTGLSQPTFGSPGASAFGTPQQSAFGQGSATSFGQTTTAPAFGQSSSTPAFGQAASSTPAFGQAPSSSVFGQSTGATAFGTPATQSTFGAPAQPAFGTPAPQPSFGAPTSQPAFGATPGQPTFGAPTTPGFGTPASTPGFGTPASTPAFGIPAATPAFGSTATPAFGSPATTSAFGTPATTSAFGTTATSALSFGTPTTTTGFGSATTPLTFGSNQPKPTFGTPTTQSAPLSFGASPAQPTATSQASGFQFGTNLGQTGFGAPATTTAAASFGTTTTQSSLTFSAPQTTASSLLFGAAKPATISLTTPATTTQSSISFGSSLTPKPSTTQGSTGFSFGTLGAIPAATTTTSAQNVSSAGLSSFTTTGLSFGSVIGGKSMLTITGNTATPLYSSKTSDLQTGRSAGQVPPKCQNVPPQLTELVESFKNHMKEQKHTCLEVSRASLKPISKVSNDAENIKRSVMKLERAVNKNKLLNTKLKEETMKALADIEVAQKAMDVPGGFPSDNSIITDYFLQLANKFQQQVLALRVELESTEKSILCELNPVAFTPQELSTTMQRLYECFVALAGTFQFVHAQISNLKVQHLELRRKKFEDYTDIFNKKNILSMPKPSFQSSQIGPSPFSGIRSMNSVISSTLRYPSTETVAANTFFSSRPPSNPMFGSTLNQPLQNNNLMSTSPQQTTPGSKRGKR